jgi:hypothetical protein
MKIRNFGTLAAIMALVFSFSFSTLALANEGKNDTPAVELKFIGNLKNQPVFQLNVTTVVSDEITVTIKDKEGVVLYSDRETGTIFARKFQINTEEIGDNALLVEVSTKKGKVQVYEINSTSRFVQENVVSKL